MRVIGRKHIHQYNRDIGRQYMLWDAKSKCGLNGD